MRNEIERLLAALACTQSRARIAEAKATLALEMIIRGLSTDLPEQKIDPQYLCQETLKKATIENNRAVAIAFNSIYAFLAAESDKNKEAIHKKKSKVDRDTRELKDLIYNELMALFPHS